MLHYIGHITIRLNLAIYSVCIYNWTVLMDEYKLEFFDL